MYILCATVSSVNKDVCVFSLRIRYVIRCDLDFVNFDQTY